MAGAARVAAAPGRIAAPRARRVLDSEDVERGGCAVAAMPFARRDGAAGVVGECGGARGPHGGRLWFRNGAR